MGEQHTYISEILLNTFKPFFMVPISKSSELKRN